MKHTQIGKKRRLAELKYQFSCHGLDQLNKYLENRKYVLINNTLCLNMTEPLAGSHKPE